MGVRLDILFFLSFFILSQGLCQVNNSFRSNFFYQKNELNKQYHIVFLLPFCTNNNDFLNNSHIDSLISTDLEDVDLYKKTKISVDFYLGFLSSLQQFDSLNIKISIFDIKEGNESKSILKNIINNRHLDSVDLIIGPLFTDNFIFFKDIFDKKVPIVSPFSKKPNIVEGNENVIQIPASLTNQLRVLSKYIFEKHLNDNLLLVRRDTLFNINQENMYPADSLIIDTLIPNDVFYSDIILSNIDTVNMLFEEIKVQSDVIDSIYHKLDTVGIKNVIIIPSEDDVFVTDLLSKLHACRDTNMIVYGMPMLSNFNHVSIYDLMDMQVTFPHNKIFNEQEINDFIINFSSNHHYIPNLKYSSVGYELGSYFLEDLLIHGSILTYIHNTKTSKTILGRTYAFEKEKKGGYKNKAALIFQYEDFGFRQIH
tara:strand:+ start:4209 stop:5483 length:1275 start_codon:yes stop_codon:yes gene_type:complete